jgi:hypothetical protein
MDFSFVDELNITVDLSILNRDTQRKNFLLYQHEGEFLIDDFRAGNVSQIDVTNQFDVLFQVVQEKNPDLFVTPEYSCPWAAIQNLIDKQIWPQHRKLWAIGCESISKNSLRELNWQNENVFVHFEQSVLQEANAYLDPLIYMFRGLHENREKLILIIQFKTHHMSAWGGADIERNNFIQGNTIYVLRNQVETTYLFSLICSEAMSFRDRFTDDHKRQLGWHDNSFLILNPQLNPDPLHAEFTSFRKFISDTERKGLLSLNWNNNSMYQGRLLMKNKTSRSGFYLRTNEIDYTDRRVRHNHNLGLYYCHFVLNKHAFIINGKSNLLLVSCTAINIINAVPQQARHDGPEIREVLNWNPEKTAFIQMATVSDNHVAHLTSIGCTNAFLINDATSILEKEKIVSLTTGKIKKNVANWWGTNYLFTFSSSEATEPNRRITFIEDDIAENTTLRNEYVSAVQELDNHILPNKLLYPDSLSHLKRDELIIAYAAGASNDNFRFNITTTNGERRIATLCFLGYADDTHVGRTFDLIQDIFDNNDNNRRCVVIFYRRGAVITCKSDPDAGKFNLDNEHTGPSFLK